MPSVHKIIRKRYELKKLIKYCKQTGYACVDFETNAMPIPHPLFYPTILGDIISTRFILDITPSPF